MATTSATVQSLFGMTPEALQQSRMDQLDAQALQFARLTPMQQAQMGFFRAGSQLGTGLAGAMGYEDPEMKRIKERQGLLGGLDLSNPEALRQAAKQAQMTNPQLAQQLLDRAAELDLQGAQLGKEQALMAKAQEEAKAKQAEVASKTLGVQGRAAFIKRKLPELTDIEAQGLAADEAVAREMLKEPQAKFETKTVDGKIKVYKVTPEGYQEMQTLGAAQGSEISQLTAAIQQERLAAAQRERMSAEEKAASEKRSAINALSAAEGDVETSLNTAEAALGLAPNTVLGGTMQAVSSAIPWTDAKALANLVQSLNSDKVLAVLQQLKNQSRTGATGFGALSEKELDLILAKTRALDPTDKMFRENLGVVVNGWKKIKENLAKERRALQGQAAPTKRFNPATGKLEEVK